VLAALVSSLLLLALAAVGFEIRGCRAAGIPGLSSTFNMPYLVSRALSITGLLCLLGAMAATPFVNLKPR